MGNVKGCMYGNADKLPEAVQAEETEYCRKIRTQTHLELFLLQFLQLPFPSHPALFLLHPLLVVAAVAAVAAQAAAEGSGADAPRAARQDAAHAGEVEQHEGYPDDRVDYGNDLAEERLRRESSVAWNKGNAR